MFQKHISCCVMFRHVQACSACSKHVSSMFSKPEQAEHAIDCKMAIFSLTMFHYLFACSGMFSMFSMFRSCFKHVTCMFMHVSYVFKPFSGPEHTLNMPNMINIFLQCAWTFILSCEHLLARPSSWLVSGFLPHWIPPPKKPSPACLKHVLNSFAYSACSNYVQTLSLACL